MKTIFTTCAILLLSLVLLQSCSKEDNFPRTETITNGSKWGLQIGSSALEVYTQLQQLGVEKGFTSVSIVGQHYFSKPEKLQERLPFYRGITLQSPDVVIHRVFITFSGDEVSSIEQGGGMLTEINKWPQNLSNEMAVHKGDKIDKLYDKLVALYQMPAYSNYLLILPEKTLSKNFDPEMTNYDEWRFGFGEDVKPGRRRRTSVRLFFKNGKLEKISCSYDENDVYH